MRTSTHTLRVARVWRAEAVPVDVSESRLVASPGEQRQGWWVKAVPFLFIVIWASGYVVARFGLPYAPPLTFLCARYAGVIAVMGVLALLARAPWPRTRADAAHLCVAGLLMQAGYLGGVWCAIETRHAGRHCGR